MSFLEVRQGIHATLRAHTRVRIVYGGMSEPQTTPAYATEFLGTARQGQTNVFHWRFMLHCYIANQANDIAESSIDEMVDATLTALSPKLLDSNNRPRAMLGGVANMCWFEDVRSGMENDGYITFGDGPTAKQYRHIGFVLMVKTQEAY